MFFSFMIWWHKNHDAMRKNHVSTQADTVSCQSKLKRVEGKISNSRRSVDSVVWSKSRLTFSFLELLGGLINPHIVLAPPSLVFHTVSWLFWPGLKCCFAPTWACFDDTPLRWITAPTPQHGHAPLHSTLFDSKSSQLKIYSIDCNTIHYSAHNCTSSSLANPEHSHLNIFFVKTAHFCNFVVRPRSLTQTCKYHPSNVLLCCPGTFHGVCFSVLKWSCGRAAVFQDVCTLPCGETNLFDIRHWWLPIWLARQNVDSVHRASEMSHMCANVCQFWCASRSTAWHGIDMSKCADADAGSTQADADADAASPWLKPSPGVLSDGAIVLLPSNTVCLLYDPLLHPHC